MLPPGEISYYYTVNGEPTLQLSDLIVKSIKTEKGLRLLQLKVPKTTKESHWKREVEDTLGFLKICFQGLQG